MTRGERIIVNECNQVKGLSNIFAIGDVCWMAEPDYPNGHPQVAQVAIQQGELLAENLQRIEALKKPRPFHYKNLGTLATVGRNKAVADLNKVKLHGFTAWLVWMLVHLRSILGIKNNCTDRLDLELFHVRPFHAFHLVHPKAQTRWNTGHGTYFINYKST